MLTHGSLFTGIGGFDLGFERAGFKTVWQVEINPYCRQVLERHWPHVRRFADIRDFGERFLLERPDIITGGDPCQENSNARQSADTISPSLGSEFIKVVDVLRPRFVLRENPSVTRSDAPWPWWRFRSELERLGYAVLPFEFRACCIGADHKRERLFLLAELQDTNLAGLEGDEREILEGTNGRQGHKADLSGPARWSAAPRICGRDSRIPARTHRLRSLGNAVVPQIAQWIAERILEARV
jgi:DNA (cytosine-5)-methyltransferase 1